MPKWLIFTVNCLFCAACQIYKRYILHLISIYALIFNFCIWSEMGNLEKNSWLSIQIKQLFHFYSQGEASRARVCKWKRLHCFVCLYLVWQKCIWPFDLSPVFKQELAYFKRCLDPFFPKLMWHTGCACSIMSSKTKKLQLKKLLYEWVILFWNRCRDLSLILSFGCLTVAADTKKNFKRTLKLTKQN